MPCPPEPPTTSYAALGWSLPFPPLSHGCSLNFSLQEMAQSGQPFTVMSFTDREEPSQDPNQENLVKSRPAVDVSSIQLFERTPPAFPMWDIGNPRDFKTAPPIAPNPTRMLMHGFSVWKSRYGPMRSPEQLRGLDVKEQLSRRCRLACCLCLQRVML